MKMLPDVGPKLGAFPQRPLFMRTSWTRGQSLCPAPGLVVPHELGKETGSPGQHQGGHWVYCRAQGSVLGSSCHDTHGTSLVLPCHLLATVTSAVGAHRGAHTRSPWGHQAAFLKFFPIPFLLAVPKGHFPAIPVQCCLFLRKARALYFLFHLVLVHVLLQS